MPTKPGTPCLVPTCPNRAVYRGRCQMHMRREEKMRHQEPRQQAFTAEARANAHAFLAEHPYCALCGALATEAHHIVEWRDGGSDEWENLQALCKPCHSRITLERLNKGANVGA